MERLAQALLRRSRLHRDFTAVQSARNRGGDAPEVDGMKGRMKDKEEPIEEEEAAEEEDLEDLEPTEADLDEAVVPAEPPEPVDPADPAVAEVESIQDLLVKQEARAEEEEADEEEDVAVALTKDERLEPVETRVVPIQATEFVCKRCFLVKHRSQLADKKRMLCRDCA